MAEKAAVARAIIARHKPSSPCSFSRSDLRRSGARIVEQRQEGAARDIVAMADEHGLDLRLASRKRMDRQSAGARGRLDDAARQQRDPEAARDACQYPVDGAEFELAQS